MTDIIVKLTETTPVVGKIDGKASEVSINAHNTSETSHTDIRGQLSAIDAQLAEKVQNFKIKNEVVNGDFSQGTTGFLRSANTSSIYASGNELTVNTTIQGIFGAYQTIYGAGVKYVTAEFQNSEGMTGVILGNTTVTVNIPANTWGRASSLYAGEGVQRFYGEANVSLLYKMRKPLLINLTDIFGSGNEPTKLEMDELMKVTPNGWWDGELTLTQKQYVTWQLNLIRKNTNAIIALGGTII